MHIMNQTGIDALRGELRGVLNERCADYLETHHANTVEPVGLAWWIAEAERQMVDHPACPQIEVRATDSKTGNPVIIDLPAAWFDVE